MRGLIGFNLMLFKMLWPIFYIKTIIAFKIIDSHPVTQILISEALLFIKLSLTRETKEKAEHVGTFPVHQTRFFNRVQFLRSNVFVEDIFQAHQIVALCCWAENKEYYSALNMQTNELSQLFFSIFFWWLFNYDF